MTKTELIEKLTIGQRHLAAADLEAAVQLLLQEMSDALGARQRIEVRGFGSFSVHYRPPRTGRNPRTGTAVSLEGKHAPHFKPGKALRERVNNAAASAKAPSGTSSGVLA